MPDAPPALTLTRVRRATALLASAAALGGLVELAMLRHWDGVQLVPWFILGTIAVIGVVTAREGPSTLAQAAGGLGLVGGLAGVWFHVSGNRSLGPQVIDGWDSMSGLAQWWEAFSGTLGANPALAPGLLALAGALLIVSVLDR